jgi:hypothetical protein
MEAMAVRLRQQPEKFKLRKTLAEHPFGTIKRWFGYTHFLLKGLTKVQCEWSLTTLAYNLKRVLNLVSFEKLMASVGRKAGRRLRFEKTGQPSPINWIASITTDNFPGRLPN